MNYDKFKFLKNSLLFQASLGSKELFHSNIWAWLMEMDNAFINVFFDDFDLEEFCTTANDKITVEREKAHRDIIIWLPGKRYLVIENKIKSLPNEEQLKEYSKDLWENELHKAVFTGIINPFEEDELIVEGEKTVKWHFVNYSKIAKRIRYVLKNSILFNLPEFSLARAEVEEYCKIIESLNEIISEELNSHRGQLIYSGWDKLHPLRIYDIFAKTRGSDFMNYIKSRKNELNSLKDKGFELGFWQTFNHGKATLDIRYTNYTKKCKTWFLLGVQIEAEQYRLVAECNKNDENGRDCDTLYHEMVDFGWFDDSYEKETKKIFNRPTSMEPRDGKKYNSYKNKEDSMTFIYQYYDITKDNCGYNELFENIKNDLNKASEIIRKRFLL